MKKYHSILQLIIFFISFYVIAQQVDVKGAIISSTKDNIEGINIYNSTTKKGTISNIDGIFVLNVSLNDSLRISAIQFEPVLIVINKDIINSKKLTVNLNAKINELNETVVKNSTITNGWDLSYKTLEFGYEFAPDTQTSIPNNKAAEALNDRTLKNGLNFVELFKLAFLRKKETIRENNNKKENLFYAFKQKVTNAYISELFLIPKDKVDDFIYFMIENGIDKNLLNDENKLLLIDFIHKESEKYKEKL